MNLLSLLLAVVATAGGDGQAALADLAQFPPDQQWRYKYVTTATADSDEARESLDIALRLVLPSVSRQRVLEHCLPVAITPHVYRIDLGLLKWNHADWLEMVESYPYSPTGSKNPLVVRADWLLIHLTDSEESGAYYAFVYGKRPKTRDEAFAVFGVNTAEQFSVGLVEGESGVSVAGKRRLINFPSNQRGDAWLTEDTVKLDANSDPLERPEKTAAHQGEEGIIRAEKTHRLSGVTGSFQYYFLANGQGQIVNKAPANLVIDHTGIRGVEIINGVSCISCHLNGLNWPTSNEFREYLESGVEVFADYETQEQLEAFHLSDVDKLIRRSREDFGAIVEKACGCKAPEAVARFKACVGRYDEDLTLERAACEAYMTPEEFALALALAAANKVEMGARVSGLPHGKTIPRDSWESQYTSVRQMAELWRNQ